MSNILDYMDWRGDLPLETVPLCVVDCLILARYAYAPFADRLQQEEQLTLQEAALRMPEWDQKRDGGSPIADLVGFDIALCKALGASRRFGGLTLSDYVNMLDYETEKQFSALTVSLAGDRHFVAFCGTGDSLVAWKEDFNISFMTVPAQLDAVRYLEQVAEKHPGRLILGGHSKGGNLAVYAAAFCAPEVQARIEAVYNLDGPGFNHETASKVDYDALRERIHTFVPQSSVVGMLLEHEEAYTVVHSTQSGLMQHDPYSWEVRRDGFVCLDRVTDGSHFLNLTLREWIGSLSKEEREQFISGLFRALDATGAKTVAELSGNWYKNLRIVLATIHSLEGDEGQAFGKAMRSFLLSARNNLNVFTAPVGEKFKKLSPFERNRDKWII